MTKVKHVVATRSIEEPYNEAIRQRLRLARVSRNLSQTDVRVVSASTITNFEKHDISAAKLGDLMALGPVFGMEGREFIAYLIGNEAPVLARSASEKNLDEVAIYMRDCPPEVQALCVSIIRTVTAEHRGVKPVDLQRTATRKRGVSSPSAQ